MLDSDSFNRLDAAFSGGDLEALRREIGDLGDFPNVAPDAAIGLPLVYAIDHSPPSLVRELLDDLAEQAAKQDVVMRAAHAGHDKIARMLVQAGADTSIKGTGAPGFAGKTAADLAEEAGATKLAANIRHQSR